MKKGDMKRLRRLRRQEKIRGEKKDDVRQMIALLLTAIDRERTFSKSDTEKRLEQFERHCEKHEIDVDQMSDQEIFNLLSEHITLGGESFSGDANLLSKLLEQARQVPYSSHWLNNLLKVAQIASLLQVAQAKSTASGNIEVRIDMGGGNVTSYDMGIDIGVHVKKGEDWLESAVLKGLKNMLSADDQIAGIDCEIEGGLLRLLTVHGDCGGHECVGNFTESPSSLFKTEEHCSGVKLPVIGYREDQILDLSTQTTGFIGEVPAIGAQQTADCAAQAVARVMSTDSGKYGCTPTTDYSGMETGMLLVGGTALLVLLGCTACCVKKGCCEKEATPEEEQRLMDEGRGTLAGCCTDLLGRISSIWKNGKASPLGYSQLEGEDSGIVSEEDLERPSNT